mmetsp:Transcript_15077/g.50795  ORF Transcript_15077/g.50795 Transcript_15077/m.50795 type:complete len:235 (-) Transcript_15077:85-789(-)
MRHPLQSTDRWPWRLYRPSSKLSSASCGCSSWEPQSSSCRKAASGDAARPLFTSVTPRDASWSRKATPGLATARRVILATRRESSAPAVLGRWCLLRATARLENMFLTETVVPGARASAAGPGCVRWPCCSTVTSEGAAGGSTQRLTISTNATVERAWSASPRKPKVCTPPRSSSSDRIFEVAALVPTTDRACLSMPRPLSRTLSDSAGMFTVATISVAPASRELKTSSSSARE